MNIFALCTGRCGSVTFAKACSHITNYTSSHESKCQELGESRISFPDNHIECDLRLSFFLGRLDEMYGRDAFYVHLMRNPEEVALSFSRKYERGVIRAYQIISSRVGAKKNKIRPEKGPKGNPIEVGIDYCHTINSNIRLFLKDKLMWMNVCLDTIKRDFEIFWERIGAEGDLSQALAELDIKHNSSKSKGLVK